MQTKYETIKKEAEIEKLNSENRGKSRQIFLLAAGLAVVCMIAAVMVWLYRRVHRQKQVIGRQSKQLETVMKELHHRVKNNLQIVSSLLSLQSHKLDDEDAIAAIRQSQQRVQAMSLIHQRLYQTDESAFVNIRAYLTDLAESLLCSYGYDAASFDLRVTADQELLDVDKVLLLGLIANEVLTNAFKYAFEGVERPSLEIHCTGDDREFVLSIRDNGRGWDVAKWEVAGGSFGKQLVTALCRQLRAKQELRVVDGTEFRFRMMRQAEIA